MRTYALHEARAEFSKLIDKALAGEPQRVTRRGKEVVLIVSEAAWNARPKSAPTLADLMLNTVGADQQGLVDAIGNRPWGSRRELGREFNE